jgi:hypothetical protein
MSGVCHKGERHFFALVGFTMRGIGDSLTPWWDSVYGTSKCQVRNAHRYPVLSFIFH